MNRPTFYCRPSSCWPWSGTAGLLYGIFNIIKERQANAEKAGLRQLL